MEHFTQGFCVNSSKTHLTCANSNVAECTFEVMFFFVKIMIFVLVKKNNFWKCKSVLLIFNFQVYLHIKTDGDGFYAIPKWGARETILAKINKNTAIYFYIYCYHLVVTISKIMQSKLMIKFVIFVIKIRRELCGTASNYSVILRLQTNSPNHTWAFGSPKYEAILFTNRRSQVQNGINGSRMKFFVYHSNVFRWALRNL